MESGWGQTAAGSGLTTLFVGIAYAVQKFLRRSKCKSKTACCELDIARDMTKRDIGSSEKLEALIELMKLKLEPQPLEETSHHPDKAPAAVERGEQLV